MKKITFVIPSRNNLEFLQLAYKSIRRFNTKHEILVLNAASTDGTKEILKKLQKELSSLRWVEGKKKLGYVNAFKEAPT